jgi:alpha-L-fucosidase
LTKNFNSSQIYQWSTAVLSEAKLKSITFPPNNPSRRLHLFAIAYTPSVNTSTTGTLNSITSGESDAVLSVRRVRFTTKWELIDTSPSSSTDQQKAQIVEVTLSNILPTHILSAQTSLTSNHTIRITGNGITTIRPGTIGRLVPGDQVRVDVIVSGTNARSGTATVEVRNAENEKVGSQGGWEVLPLIETWTPDADVLERHEAPTWVSGIIILII